MRRTSTATLHIFMTAIFATSAVSAQHIPELYELTGTPAPTKLGAPQLASYQLRSLVVNSSTLASNPSALGLRLLDGRRVIARRDRFEFFDSNHFHWTGILPENGWTSLTFRDGLLAGIVRWKEDRYQIIPQQNQHFLVKLAPYRFERCGVQNRMDNVTILEDCDSGNGFIPAEGTVEIDLMTLYTAAARDEAGSVAAIVAQIAWAINMANDVFINSDVNIRFRSAYVDVALTKKDGTLVEYAEDGFTPNDIEWLASDSTVASLRNQYSSDLVSLIVSEAMDNKGPICGQSLQVMARNQVTSSFAHNAFQVTKLSCIADHTFAHEHGHLMGLAHDPDSEEIPISPALTTFCFSFGHVNIDATSGPFRTIMGTQSIHNGCGSDCDRVEYFSNPDLTDPVSGEVLGIEDQRDGHRTLNLTAPIVTTFRPSNDHFRNRLAINGLAGQVRGNNSNATNEFLEPNHAGVSNTRSVWWSWTAPVSGEVFLGTGGSNFDTVLAVYTGDTLGNLVVQESDDSPGTEGIMFFVSKGTEYKIAVGGNLDSGDILLSWGVISGFVDLSVSLTALDDQVQVGETITYLADIRNDGFEDATDLIFSNGLPEGLSFVSASPEEFCSHSDAVVTCNLGNLGSGDGTQVTVAAVTTMSGEITNSVSVLAAEFEPDLSNNVSSATTTVVSPGEIIFTDGFESGDTSAWSPVP